MTCLCLITTNQAFAEDNYSLEIKPISFSVQPNVLTRNMAGTSAMAQKNHENVQVNKTCYTGETFSLTAIIVPSNAYVGEVIWSIEQDYEVAKIVSENGLSVSIVGVKAGTCTIVCTAADGQGAYTTCQLTVFQHAEKVELNFTDLLLEPGDTQQLIATVLPEDTSDKTVIWVSSDETVATVDEYGVVSAVAPSTKPVTITAQVIDGSNVTGTATVNVRVLVTEIKWETAPTKIYINGDTVEKFYTIVLPENATIPTLKYTSSDLNIATVMADKTNNSCVIVTPKNPGKFTLTCEATDGSGIKLSTEVEVIQLVEYISLNTTEKVLFLEDGKTVTHQLVATALPSNANNKKLTWVSSDDKIATVSSNGLVTAIGPGSVSVTVSAVDGGNASATCIIHVRKAISSATIDLYSFEYLQGTNIELKEKLKYLNGIAYVYSGDEVALKAEINNDATLKELIWQVAGKGTNANGNDVIGIYASIDAPRSNPSIMTALPINGDNQEGYLNIVVKCKANDGSGFTAQRVIQIRRPATSITLNKSSLTLYTKESSIGSASEKLIPTILPENAYVNKNPDSFGGQTVIWETSNADVATVSADGTVTAVGVGEAVITGRSADNHGEIASCTVTVLQAVTGLTVHSYYGDDKVDLEDGKSIYAYTNQDVRLYANIVPENASNKKLIWSSGNTDIVTIEDGYLKIGNKPTATVDENGTVTGNSVLISCATTDGSGKSFKFNLYVLDAGYNVEVEEFVSVNVGDTEKLLLKIFKTNTVNNQVVSIPVNANINISIAGNNSTTIMQMFNEQGQEIKDAQKLENVSNPSFDIKGIYDGIATITFDIELSMQDANMSGKNFIGTPISFEKTCTVNVTGSDDKKISISQESISLLVNQTKQLTAVVTPASATNYYIKYSLEQYDENYENPYQYARINEDTGTITGLSIGMVKAVATLYDATTDEPIIYNEKIEKAEIPVYITAALTGATMENTTVYVGETLNLLNHVHLLPDSLNHSTDKSTIVKFNVLSGKSYVDFSSKESGTIIGKDIGTVRIEAIATYNNAIYTTNIAEIQVKERLTNISLMKDYTIKKDTVLALTPVKAPLWGDVSSAEVVWTSSKPNVVSVALNASDNFSGIITGLTSGDADIAVTVKVGGKTLEATTTIHVLSISVNDFSVDTGKAFQLTKSNKDSVKRYYKFGPYFVKAENVESAADCVENGAFSLSTVKLSASNESRKYKNITYPTEFPLKSFLALERVEDLAKAAAIEAGYMINEDDDAGWKRFRDELNTALVIATDAMGRPDENAYLDLPDNSHIWHKVGGSYKVDENKGGFLNWDHEGTEKVGILVLTGLLTQWNQENDSSLPSANNVVSELLPSFTTTEIKGNQLGGSYMTSPLTALNVVGGSGEIAMRQSNALSILQTYFPVDEMDEHSINSTDPTYLKVRAVRQMLTWTISGVNTPKAYYDKIVTDENREYAFLQEKYTGDNMYYVCFMIQAKAELDGTSPNYMEYPYGYSAFYYACRNILGNPNSNSGRFKNINELMPIVEGFVWKLDQVKHKTIPSFASKLADEASQSENVIQLYYDSSINAYTARVNDTNGVLNYFDFSYSYYNKDTKETRTIKFVNNGDGTLTVAIPAEDAKYLKEHKDDTSRISHAASKYIPEDCKYKVATFVKHELESEILQVPYTKADGSLGYAYLVGANSQSMTLTTKGLESSLGDPIDAYINFAFNDPSSYDSEVVCDIKLYNLDGQEVEYIIPNEQYQLKYIYTYTGDSRGLEIYDKNTGKNMTVSQNMYGFAADMRARANGKNDSLLSIIDIEEDAGKYYAVSNSTTTIKDPVWALRATEVPVEIVGRYTVYNTPAGTTSSWDSGNKWNDTIKIDANVGKHELVTTGEMEASSDHTPNVNVRKEDGKVVIEWSFYTGYITFTTPYVKAEADIIVNSDSKYTVQSKVNTGLSDGDKYVYGLTIDGVQSVTGTDASGSTTINNYDAYVQNYDFTGMIANAVALASSGDSIPYQLLPTVLFEGLGYYHEGTLLSEIGINDLKDIGTEMSRDQQTTIGNIHFYYRNDSAALDGLIINIGKHGDTNYAVVWKDNKFIGTTYNAALRMFSNASKIVNFEDLAKNNNFDEAEAIRDEYSQAIYNPKTDGMKTTLNTSNANENWNKVANGEVNLKDFNMTNPLTYGGSGYFEISTEPVYANNACNYTDFHTDKTFMTVFDLSISNLVVNTGAGITSPTSIDTRNFVNLNVYYTVNLTNDAYKIITNRYGQIGNTWWHFYKDTATDGTVDKAETKYVYNRTDFFYEEGGKRIYCTASDESEVGRTYYYDPEHTGSKKLPDKMCATSTNRGDFIPDDRQNIALGSVRLTVPAGYAEEKKLDIIIHSDVFTDFCIYDNKNITGANKLDPAVFATLTAKEQLDELKKIPANEITTSLVFIDNIQTGENYVQHSVPYFLTSIESGIKTFGFSAHVNKTHDNSAGVHLSTGDDVYTNKALAEWGETLGSYSKEEESHLTNSAQAITHYSGGAGLVDEKYMDGTSLLGHKVTYLNKHRGFGKSVSIDTGLYKPYYYAAEYGWSYDNNETATGMLQYPSYNPYTLNTVSTNGSLVYKNAAGINGFDITLGNNQKFHIPNIDAISYMLYLRNIGSGNNAGKIKDSYGVQYTGTEAEDKFLRPISRPQTIDFVYQSLNFYKYSNSQYNIYNAGSANATPNQTLVVEKTPANTEIVNSTQTESYKLTKILFRSTYTVSRNLGDKGWVDITSGSNPDALVNAGKGFELKIEVTYTNNNLTDYLVRYLKDSAQIAGNNGSHQAGVPTVGCNISALTGQYGNKCKTDPYTAKVANNTMWNDVFGSNVYKDIYVVMNNNNKYVYSYSGVYGSTQVFDMDCKYHYDAPSKDGKIVMTYTMKLSPVNGFFGNVGGGDSLAGLATQNMKFYTDSSAAGTVGSLTIWTNPIAATPFGYPGNMRDRYLADIAQIQYYITQPVDNVDNIVQ